MASYALFTSEQTSKVRLAALFNWNWLIIWNLFLIYTRKKQQKENWKIHGRTYLKSMLHHTQWRDWDCALKIRTFWFFSCFFIYHVYSHLLLCMDYLSLKPSNLKINLNSINSDRIFFKQDSVWQQKWKNTAVLAVNCSTINKNGWRIGNNRIT